MEGEREARGLKSRLVTIEDVVAALASQCDGARKRDGRGFNRADAQEGGRLAALKSRGMGWSQDDARRALEIAMRYAGQAGNILGGGREARANGIESALRSGRVQLRDEPVEKQDPYNYACLSPGGKRVYLWRMTWIEDFKGLISSMRDLASIRHGVRRVIAERNPEAEITINGQRRRFERFEVDLNGSSQAAILEVCRTHGFLIEPAVEAPIELEVDELRRSDRAVWLHRGTRRGERGVWAVFDLAKRHEPFSEAVKAHLKGSYECDPDDDWNWFVQVTPATAPIIGGIARKFGFAMSAEMTGARKAQAAPARLERPASKDFLKVDPD